MAGEESSAGAPTRKFGEGAVAAAFRQGIKELGETTKAFPESIAVQEPGGMYCPTQGEIADANRGGGLWDRMQEGRERADAARAKEPEQTPDRD